MQIMNMYEVRQCQYLTLVDCPHDAECWPAYFIKWLPSGDDLPQNDAPTEDVAFLTVVTPYDKRNDDLKNQKDETESTASNQEAK